MKRLFYDSFSLLIFHLITWEYGGIIIFKAKLQIKGSEGLGLGEERKVFPVSGWDGVPVEKRSGYKSSLYITSLYSVIYMIIIPHFEAV